jgi:hypothetical protein
MNTRRLTKKYKNKNRKPRKTSKTRRRVLNGGVRSVRSASVQTSVSTRPPSRQPSQQPSQQPTLAHQSRHSFSTNFKHSSKAGQYKLINSFFHHLRDMKFPQALCALYNLYNSLPYMEINDIINSESFKTRYEETFYTQEIKQSLGGVNYCNTRPKKNYIYFLAYIFKKIIKGGFIFCNGKKQYFVYSKDKQKIRMLAVLKRFLGYLDTACVITISYSISIEKYKSIDDNPRHNSASDEEKALYDIVSTLIKFSPIFPSLKDILDNMESRDRSTGRIVSYNMNTTVLSSIIKQSYTDFLKPIREDGESDEDSMS